MKTVRKLTICILINVQLPLSFAATATARVTLTATVIPTGTLTATPSVIVYGNYSGSPMYGLSTLAVATNNPAATLSASVTSGSLTATGSTTPIGYTLTRASSSSSCTNSSDVGTAWTTINPVASGNYYACFSLANVSNPNIGAYATNPPITFTLTY